MDTMHQADDVRRKVSALSIAATTGLPELAAFIVPQATISERLAAGRALRTSLARRDLSVWLPSRHRQDPLERLSAQNAHRVEHLVPLRMGRMSASPFAFLRGSAAVMAADLAGQPITGAHVMACGDMHLANFGLFASAERNLVFAINDFDEAHPGFWEWDLKRLAASAAVAARHLGGSDLAARAAAEAAAAAYAKQMRRYSEMGVLQIWYDKIDAETILAAVPQRFRKRTQAIIGKARSRGHQRSLERLTKRVGGQHRLIEDRPIVVRESHVSDGTPVAQALDAMLTQYRASLPLERDQLLNRYRIVDVVRKVVGVGSVGTGCWVILLEGEGPGDPLFLQVKEAQPSVLAEFMPETKRFDNQGTRVVTGQRLIQGSPDIFLGWGRTSGKKPRDFYVRQLADMKGSLDILENDRETLAQLSAYAALCGRALALAHAKSGDAALISGYCGIGEALPLALGKFAMAYADQTEKDHETLCAAVRAGRIQTIQEI